MLIKLVFLDCILPPVTIGPQLAETGGLPAARDSPIPIAITSTFIVDLSFLALAVDERVYSDHDLYKI